MGLVIRLEGAGEIAQNAVTISPLRDPRFAQFRLKCDGLIGSFFNRCGRIRVRIYTVEKQKTSNRAQPRPGYSKFGIEFNSLGVGRGSLLIGRKSIAIMLDGQAAQVGVERGNILGRLI